MKMHLIITSLLFLWCTVAAIAVTDPLLDELLKRNGDVYLLVSDSKTDTGHLYLFDRSDEYRRSDVIPGASPLKTKIPQYVGFAVDKFGHVKLFRAKDDIDNPTGSTSILALTGRNFPGQSGGVQVGFNSMNLPASTSVKATSAGWRYVIAPDGKEGWKYLFVDGSKNMTAVKGSFTLSPINGAIPVGSVILPPYFKSMPFEYYLSYHSGFWQGGRNDFRVQAVGAPAILTVISRNDWGSGGNLFETDSCWYDIPYAQSEELWGVGPIGYTNCGLALSPPIGAFFMIPHYNGSWTNNFSTYRAATLVKDAKKSVKTLLVNTFLSQKDNSTLQNFGPTSGIFTRLQSGRDYFTGVSSEGYSDASDNVLANTVSFSVDAGRWNHCGDLCGLGPSDSPASPPPPPSSRAYASSFGDNQDEQKLYMIRRASYGGSNVVTSVVEIRVAQGGTSQAILVNPNQTCPNSHEIDKFGIDCRSLGDADSTFSNLDKQVVYKAFASDLGVSGNFPNYPQSLGFSKRRDGSKSDYVYWSNLPPTHFTVSSNFWGTGGTIWYAVQNGDNLKLHFKNFNHTVAGASSIGVIDAEDRLPIKALAADGDNNVYLVHSKDAVEGPDQIERQFGSAITKASVQELCGSGIMKNCAALDFNGGMTACMNVGVPTDPLGVDLVIKQHAGFVVEKLSPVTGSQPVKLGVVPNVEIGECRTKAYFPLSSSETASCKFRWDRPASGTDPWTCTATGGGVDLSQINVELAVINVPNPPASGTGMNPRIVHPCYANSTQICDTNKTMIEDQEYVFRMENPPHFAGVPAVLGQSSDGILRNYGTVRMISNYEKSGYDYTRELVLKSPEAGTINDLYFDDDGEVGVITATILNEKFGAPADHLMSASVDQGVPAKRTMRYRWIVRAKSPPHSLVDYTQNDLEFRPAGYPSKLKSGCISIINPTGTRVLNDGITVYQFPQLQDPAVVNKLGLMYDSCWQDLDREIAVDPQNLSVIAPDNLNYKFVDPGVYEVTLMIGALGFDLEGITYRSDPASVRASIIVTHHTMKVNVGAQKPGTNPFVTDVSIGMQDLKSGKTHSWLLPEDTLSISEHKDAFAAKSEGNLFKGPVGALPIYPTHYYSDQDLIVTQEGQITPLYAEAKIRFFRTENTAYLSSDPNPPPLSQQRMDGAGVWDFSYGCIANSNCGEVGSLKLTDKSKEHPSNYGQDSAGKMVITSKFGNDASLDITTRRGSGRFMKSVGGTLTEGLSADENEMHQGTLAREEYYPDGKNIESSPHAFYTWYDFKYAWFARFKTPDGTIRKQVIRTGNLAEIFLLNFYANHYGSNKTNFKKLIKNVLAPQGLQGTGFDIGEGKLITQSDQTTREYQIRIPLMENNAIFKSSDLISEMDGNFKDGWRTKNDWETKKMSELLAHIRPMKFDIPTGATVLEIGCQLFVPVMTWQGNQPIITPAGVTSNVFSYYDAVPGAIAAGDIVPANGNHPRIIYNFGPDNFETWATKGQLKIPDYGEIAEDTGLQLSAIPGGFIVDKDGKANYQMRSDHFVEINVVDQQNPVLTVETGGSQTLQAGQANQIPIKFEIKDNNPFQAWVKYDSDPSDSGTIEQGTPVLSNFYYELGYDSRSRMGLGLLNNKSYSFHLSHRQQENFLRNAAFNFEANAEDAKYNLPEVYPGEPAPDQLSSDANNFFTFGEGVSNRDNDQLFDSELLHPTKVSMYAARDFYWNRKVEKGSFFPPAVDGSVKTSDVYVDSSNNTRNQPMLYQFSAPHVPDGGLNYFEWPTESSNSNRRKLIFISEDFSKDCLKSALPHQELSSNCSKTATYELQTGAVFAPIFFNNDYEGLSHKVFAAAQDARIYADYSEAGNVLTPDINSYHYRLAGKSSARAFAPSDLSGSSVNNLRLRAQEILYEPLAQEIGTFTYMDSTPPNLRVVITDYKSRQSIFYSLLMVESVDKNAGDNRITSNPRINIYRSADSRANEGHFASSAIKKTLLSRTAANEYTISSYSSDSDNPSEVFYEITEDTRFQVHATFSDNVTGKELNGEIEMSSGSCSDIGPIAGTVGGVTLAPLDGEFMEQYRFPSVSKSAGEYQDLAELRAYHLYPKNGYFDTIKVVATDSVGNKSGICIPVRVISQDVHFRQIGNQSKSR